MRLTEFRGSAAGSSLKASKYPKCLPRALNSGGFLVSPEPCSFPSHCSGDWRVHSPFTLMMPVLWCSVCLGAGLPRKSCFVCLYIHRQIQLKLFIHRNLTLPTSCDTQKLPWQGRCHEYFGFDKLTSCSTSPNPLWGIPMTGPQAVSQTKLHPGFPNSGFPHYWVHPHPSGFGAPQEFWSTLLLSVLFHSSSSLAYPGKPEYFYIIDLISPMKAAMAQWTEYSSFLLEEEWSCTCSLGLQLSFHPLPSTWLGLYRDLIKKWHH